MLSRRFAASFIGFTRGQFSAPCPMPSLNYSSIVDAEERHRLTDSELQQGVAIDGQEIEEEIKMEEAMKRGEAEAEGKRAPWKAPWEADAEERARYSYGSETLNKLNYDKYPYYIEREWWKNGKRTNFWANWEQKRDIERRKLLKEHGADRMRFEALKTNNILPQAVRDEFRDRLDQLPKGANPKLIMNLCMFTGRRRGKFAKFRINRHIFRQLADASQLSGVMRSVW